MRFGFEDLVAIMALLRSVEGCPWDREQTHASLAPYLLEETHEVLDAISKGDPTQLRAELGDLLLQVVFHAQMARETETFDADAVVDGLVRKLLDRHPHVFGDLRLGTAREVKAHWEESKRREAPDRARFDGIPASLPALARAQKLLERVHGDGSAANRPGFAAATAGARTAVDDVVTSLTGITGGESAASAERLGALLFAVAVLAEATGVDAESALRRANDTFVAERSSNGPGA